MRRNDMRPLPRVRRLPRASPALVVAMLGAVIGAVACQPASRPPLAAADAVTSGSQGAADSVVVLLRSQSSGLTASRELAIRDAETWRATWATLQAAGPSDGAGGAPAPPAVDFAREMVLLVASGERSSGGWDVTVDAVERGSDGGATVRYTITEPGPGCMTAQVITAPAVAVRAARVAGTVRFAGRTVRRDC